RNLRCARDAPAGKSRELVSLQRRSLNSPIHDSKCLVAGRCPLVYRFSLVYPYTVRPHEYAPRENGTPDMPYIGIDFGTSNSGVANFHYGQAEVVPNQEGQLWTPSVVTLRRDGSLAFGQEAKENFDEQRSIRSIKRILGTPERVPLVGQNLRT